MTRIIIQRAEHGTMIRRVVQYTAKARTAHKASTETEFNERVTMEITWMEGKQVNILHMTDR